MDHGFRREAPRVFQLYLFRRNVGNVIREPDHHPPTAGNGGFARLLRRLEHSFVEECGLGALHAASLLNGLNQQLMIGGEILKQLGRRRINHDRSFIFRLQMLQRLQSPPGERLQHRPDTISQIKKKYDGERQLVLAYSIDLLPYAVLEQLEIICGQIFY